jgi:hypothetical protein
MIWLSAARVMGRASSALHMALRYLPKEDLGLKNFKHIHNAALPKIGDKFYIIAQAWNPGDLAILEQVGE